MKGTLKRVKQNKTKKHHSYLKNIIICRLLSFGSHAGSRKTAQTAVQQGTV